MVFLICFILIVVALWIVSEVIGTIMDYIDMRKDQ
jgi:Na+-transporting methylmalonyl-CoA/oxaloacetate decarboxylase gamma subunit